MKFNFSGYATKNDLLCSDGRVIKKDAFKHQDGDKVPLVWHHLKNDPANVLGHAILENRQDGVYAYCVFNDTDSGKNAQKLVEHGDIETLSIHANQLQQRKNEVIHGMIREVSLVVAGANPGAKIDNICIVHADGSEVIDDTEAIICNDIPIDAEEIEHEIKKGGSEMVGKKKEEDMTVGEIFDTLTDVQKEVVYGLLGQMTEEMKDDDEDEMSQEDVDYSEMTHEEIFETLSEEQQEVVMAYIEHAYDEGKKNNSDNGGDNMKKNVFDGQEEKKDMATLSHADVQSILTNAKKTGSLREAFLEHAGTYGIDNIDYLFPDAKTLRNTPDFIKRNTEWVKSVLDATHKSPFSRIKSVAADITADEARAKGYVTGELKTEEVFGLLRRTTTPTTVYKKQKLDRDDIIDITDLDVIAWLKMEMRMMLDEEIARAILIGDQRAADHADKINESSIRPIYKDDDMYNHKVTVASDATTQDVIEAIIRARTEYKGSGTPTFYCNSTILTDMLLLKDTTGRYIYDNLEALAARLRVKDIIEVPVMDGVERVDGDDTHDLLGVIINLRDYTVGADKGGQVSMFDDFDIDYNQYKYLLEGRMSGALTVPKSAMTVEKTQAAG